MILLTLPMPPTINDYYAWNRKTGRPYTKKSVKEYRNTVARIVANNGWDFQANVPISMEVLLNFGNKRVQDLDNRMKGLQDALTKANVYEDDYLIDKLTVLRGRTTGEPNVKITIQAMEDLEDD